MKHFKFFNGTVPFLNLLDYEINDDIPKHIQNLIYNIIIEEFNNNTFKRKKLILPNIEIHPTYIINMNEVKYFTFKIIKKRIRPRLTENEPIININEALYWTLTYIDNKFYLLTNV